MAGTTNLLQWNPTATNQENDAAYLADSQRAGGATDPSLFMAELANKAFFQWSTFLTGLFQAFANKGFTTSDSNISTLTAQCANFLTTADLLPAVQLVGYAASVTLNAAQANGFYIEAMTGNLTIAAINGLTSGQLVALYYQQDAAGGRTVAFPSNMVGAAQPDPTANAVSSQVFSYDSTTGFLRAVTLLLGSRGYFTLANPGSAGQVLTNVAGMFVPETPPVSRGATISNGNGSYFAWSDGVKEAWGLSANSSATGVSRTTVTVTFPVAFSNPPVVVCSPNANPDSYGAAAFACYPTNVTTTGFTASLCAGVTIGGSGPADINNPIRINFMAKGI